MGRLPLFFLPFFHLLSSFPPMFLSLPAPQSTDLILISDEMIALLFRFFFSTPSHRSCHRNGDVHVCVPVSPLCKEIYHPQMMPGGVCVCWSVYLCSFLLPICSSVFTHMQIYLRKLAIEPGVLPFTQSQTQGWEGAL